MGRDRRDHHIETDLVVPRLVCEAAGPRVVPCPSGLPHPQRHQLKAPVLWRRGAEEEVRGLLPDQFGALPPSELTQPTNLNTESAIRFTILLWTPPFSHASHSIHPARGFGKEGSSL